MQMTDEELSGSAERLSCSVTFGDSSSAEEPAKILYPFLSLSAIII